jgi:hypothetical protein
VTRIAQNKQQPEQKAKGGIVVGVALYAGTAFDGRRNMWLTAEPGKQPIGVCSSPLGLGPSVSAQRSGESGGASSYPREPLLDQLIGASEQRLIIACRDRSLGKRVLLEGEEPCINDIAESATAPIDSGQSLYNRR